MTRVLTISAATLALVGCVSPTHRSHPGVISWERHPPINADAAKVQQITAMQAKQARCGTEVTQRQGTDGTSPRDYKCKRFQS